MTETFQHYTAMSKEMVDGLNIKPDGVYVDYTFGGAGYSECLLSQLSSEGHLCAFSQDQKAIDHAKPRLTSHVEQGMVTFIKANFRESEECSSEHVGKVNGILYGLGVSSPQLDEAECGFSYHQGTSLDMRMNQLAPLSTYHVINEYSYRELVKIFFRHDEGKFSRQIAREIERVRKTKPIQTAGELVEITKQVILAPVGGKSGYPVKRVLQAVRIAVNDEFGAEEASLEQTIQLSKVNGRISVITFHSLEDRIVKSMLKEYNTVQDSPPGLPVIPSEFQPELKVVTHKPTLPSEEELTENSRLRNAKLRIAEKIRTKEEQNDDRIKENARL